MANINLRALHEQKGNEFATRGAGLLRFDEDFLTATNRAINRINREADLATRISRVTSISGVFVDLDADYEDVLSDGITLYLLHLGRRPAKNAEPLVKQVEERFSFGISMIQTDKRNDQHDADSDDDTTDIAQLGTLGD